MRDCSPRAAAVRPIVFTSAAAEGSKRPGDWGGVIILGRAPSNHRDANGQPTTGKVEGLTSGGDYGGSDQNDDSGVLKYVRIEYSGVAIAPNNEVNGLTFGGVGRGTIVDYVQVRHTADDCFEFFGGTVNAKHLICHYNGDDGFDWDNGYQGKLQFLVLQQDPTVADETNGFEGDNDALGSANTPLSGADDLQRHLVRQERGSCKTAVRHAAPARHPSDHRQHDRDRIRSRHRHPRSLDADRSQELDLFRKRRAKRGLRGRRIQSRDPEGRRRSVQRAHLVCRARSQELGTQSGHRRLFHGGQPQLRARRRSLTENAATPPNDGFFDTSATYIGAFRNASDRWATGAWVQWTER